MQSHAVAATFIIIVVAIVALLVVDGRGFIAAERERCEQKSGAAQWGVGRGSSPAIPAVAMVALSGGAARWVVKDGTPADAFGVRRIRCSSSLSSDHSASMLDMPASAELRPTKNKLQQHRFAPF